MGISSISWFQMMPRYSFFFSKLLGLILACFSLSVSADSGAAYPGPGNATCPLDFRILQDLFGPNPPLFFFDVPTECYYIMKGILVVRSQYLRTTRYFSLPSNSAEPCWDHFDSLVNENLPGFDSRSTCGVDTDLISVTCMNITTRSQFEASVAESKLQIIRDSCSQSLDTDSNCLSCKESLTQAFSPFFGELDFGNASAASCSWYPSIYASASVNPYGPTDSGTAECLFSMNLDYLKKSKKGHNKLIPLAVVGCLGGFLGVLILAWMIWRRRKVWRMRNRKRVGNNQNNKSDFIVELVSGDTALIKFRYDEIKMATNNFSNEYMIGKGGFGNVYFGKLQDGSEVAVKRFKNCSAGGDIEFAHELEVIASIRHVNLIGLRGYCIATLPLEGHQRIIVSDLMQNGSLSDHLFDPSKKRLAWPVRQKIAIGVARGLAYLHFGAQPGIIHRDVKASNILLDKEYEPKLADFGFSKFTPDEFSHLSTRVAGTLGYIAPEYALYGQLTEKTDVYGFGVVLLQLLSGKRAVVSVGNHETLLLTDWAWSLVRQGRILDVIDEKMPLRGSADVMEKYVLVAVIASHPVLYARPTMDEIVKILESDDLGPPLIHERSLNCSTNTGAVELHASFFGFSSTSGLTDEVPKSDHPILDRIDSQSSKGQNLS